MKSLVLSGQAANRLSENFLGFRDQDELFEHLHSSLEIISRISDENPQQLSLKIDSLQIVLKIEIYPTMMVIEEVYILNSQC